MRRSFTARLLALAWAFLAAASTPTLALAHGETHHHAAEHATEHAAPDTGLRAASEFELEPQDSPADHPHTELSARCSTRCELIAGAALPATPVAMIGSVHQVREASTPDVHARAGPSRDSPRQPRAPPLG